MKRVGPYLNYTVYIYGIFGREITKYTVICGVYIRLWPTLCMNNRNTLSTKCQEDTEH